MDILSICGISFIVASILVLVFLFYLDRTVKKEIEVAYEEFMQEVDKLKEKNKDG